MDDCHTPNVINALEFSFNRSPSVVNRIPDRNQETQKLVVSKQRNSRCFTPTLDDFRSPGLSPIFAIAAGSPVTPKPKHAFKKPNPMSIKRNRYNPSPNELQQSLQDSFTEASIELSTSIKSESSGSDKSKSCSFLNHGININQMLKNVGLEKYTELFCGIAFENFLKFEQNDLKQMGLKSNEHCKMIMELLEEFNNY